jgi:hypothetical protein
VIISDFTNNYILSSYNTQQKVDIIQTIRIETSYMKSWAKRIRGHGHMGKISEVKK